jgi:hypothetical protein
VSDLIQNVLVKRLQQSLSLERPYSEFELVEVKKQTRKEEKDCERAVTDIYMRQFKTRTGTNFVLR